MKYNFIIIILIILAMLDISKSFAQSNIHNSRLIVPFKLKFDPIKYLLVADFKDDPEFNGIEPQLLDDYVNGKGLRILMYKKDRKVDVYCEKGVSFMDSTVSLGTGLGEQIVTEFKSSQFEINDTGVRIDISFTDKEGRNIKLYIQETRSKKVCSLLAPVSKDVDNPQQLLLVYLRDFRFVGKSKTSYDIKIGDRNVILAKFPFAVFSKKYFARYSSQPLVGMINPQTNILLTVDKTNSDTFDIDGMKVETNSNGEILSISSSYGINDVKMTFPTGFPNISYLENDKTYKSDWSISISNDIITGGIFVLNRKDNIVNLELYVTQKWKPNNLVIVVYIIPFFRKWPTTYQWKATINLDELSLKEEWIRKK